MFVLYAKSVKSHRWRQRVLDLLCRDSLACVVLIHGGLTPAHAEHAPAPPPPGIDVRQVIEVTKLIQPDAQLLVNRRVEDEISPDEKHVFVITRRQDVASNQNVYQLLLFETVRWVSNKRRKPLRPEQGRVLVEARSSSNFVFEHAIRSARWRNDTTIAFLGEFNDQPTQAYEVNIATGALRQLSHHDSEVLSFVYDYATGVVAYVARVPPPPKYSPETTSFIAGNTPLTRLLFPSDLPKQEIFYQYYRSFRDDPTSRRALGEPFRMGRVPPLMSLSPNGRFLITRRTPRSFEDSLRLANTYPPLKTLVAPFLAQDEDPESLFTEAQTSLLMQMAIYDVRSGTALPWYDVPDATSVGPEWPFAHWLPGGESVVIANTFLPLEGTDPPERSLRVTMPALIEYWPASGRYTRIANLAPTLRSFQGLYASAARPGAVFVKENGAYTTFVKRGSDWVRDDTLHWSAELPTRVRGRLRLAQSLNEPPELTYRVDGRDVTVTDLNPQLRRLDIGRALPYTWRDGQGREWRGGLLLPSSLASGRRYPLVIQLYGFPRDQFYLDGASGIATAMAGRAYLREGILVLAVPTDYLWSTSSGDPRSVLFTNARGIAAGIAQLAADGLIDPHRVGLVGFSATGHIVQHVMTFTDIPLRAVTLADAGSHSLFSAAAYFYGSNKPGMLFAERRLDARPWGETAMMWAQRDPSFHTDCINAAVRYEFNDIYPHPHWDTYALLRRQYKPVEAVFFPRGAHQLRRPRERYDSLQGNVDWYRFWLKDEEDGAPEKVDQYRRWRLMRARAPAVQRHAGCSLTE